MTLHNYQAIGAMPLLERLGFRFEMDYDLSVSIVPPPAIAVADVLELLAGHESWIGYELKRRAEWARRQYHGGPLHGQRHNENHWCKRAIARHLGPARWAAYTLDDDDRALFAGETTSAKKARQLAYRFLEQLVDDGRVKPFGS